MESSWRRNILALGLGDLGITVCSPWLFSAQQIITNAGHIPAAGIFLQAFLPDMADSPYLFGTGVGIRFTNFPYGIPVIPDVPL